MIIPTSQNLFVASAVLGFCAQMVGSSLGMAYSVTCSSVLLAMGTPPAMVSATVHTSEIANRLFSGISHFRFGNTDPVIFKPLALYGMAGALIGAAIVTTLPIAIMRPLVAATLLIMGLRIISMAYRSARSVANPVRLGPLGFAGGLVDVIGGGGWGPVVTSTLILKGHTTHMVVGSINFAKFFVAMIESAALLAFIRSPQWTIIGGLISGGLLAAPLAAWGCRKLPPKPLMILVGTLVCGLSIRTLVKALA